MRRPTSGSSRDVSTRHGGREIASLGDGVVVELPSVTSALDCAAAMHRGLLRHNRHADVELVVRISVAAGELTGADGWDEPPVAHSHGPAVGGRRQPDRDRRPSLRLTSDPVHESEGEAHESDNHSARLLHWSPTHLVPLQPQLASEHRVMFTGHVHELVLFDKAWHAVLAGETQTLFVSGEAGIGQFAAVEGVRAPRLRVWRCRAVRTLRRGSLRPVPAVPRGPHPPRGAPARERARRLRSAVRRCAGQARARAPPAHRSGGERTRRSGSTSGWRCSRRSAAS